MIFCIDDSGSFLQACYHPQLSHPLYILREDKIHPEVSGNKWRKLKWNLVQAKAEGKSILTFGGPFSNHIAATAHACALHGVAAVGLIRGYEEYRSNPTLRKAQEQGMHIQFLPKRIYDSPAAIEFAETNFSTHYIIPAGGANAAGIRGCEEIIKKINVDFDYIFLAVGTGTTLAGLAKQVKKNQKIIGVSVINQRDLLAVERYIAANTSAEQRSHYQICGEYDFGGYAKTHPLLLQFMSEFTKTNGIPLDYVYTGKVFFALYDWIAKGYIPPNSRVVAVHTGGLQGNILPFN